MPRIPVINTSHLDRIDELLVDDFESGEFKLHRSVFTDQALFDLEMKYILKETGFIWPMRAKFPITTITTQPILAVSQSSLHAIVMAN